MVGRGWWSSVVRVTRHPSGRAYIHTYRSRRSPGFSWLVLQTRCIVRSLARPRGWAELFGPGSRTLEIFRSSSVRGSYALLLRLPIYRVSIYFIGGVFIYYLGYVSIYYLGVVSIYYLGGVSIYFLGVLSTH